MTERVKQSKAKGRGRPDGWYIFRSNFLFMRKFFKHGIHIASVWPSSRFMAQATINQVDFSGARVIVELGAGTGPITQELVDRLQPHTRFIAIERDPDFAQILRERFAGHANVEIVVADVRDLETVLKSRSVDQVDYFISGLPTPSLPVHVRRRMLVAIRRYLTPQGVFSNITEVPWYYLKYYKAVFQDVSFELVTFNMPPGGVYHCRGMR